MAALGIVDLDQLKDGAGAVMAVGTHGSAMQASRSPEPVVKLIDERF
jgi:hypothetical protein